MKNIIQRMQDVRTSYALLNGVALVTNWCGLTRKYWRLLLFSFICIEPVAGSFAFSAAEKYSEECGGVTYSYWIVGQNAIINKVVGDMPKISIPSMLGGCRVTEIEAHAFYKNSAEIIIVPDGVTKIETCAFDSCPNLIQLRIPGTVEKCELITKNCLNLEEVSVPDREPDVRFDLFSLFGYDNQYKKLRRVEISDGATTLFHYSFMGCTSVEKICFPVTLRSIQGSVFMGVPVNSVGISDTEMWCGVEFSGLPEWGEHQMFSEDELISNLDIKESSVVKDGVFSCAASITNVVFGESVCVIGAAAFKGCSGLRTVKFSSNLQSIGEQAFYGTKLKKVKIGKSVFIGADAFPADCVLIKPVVINVFGGSSESVYDGKSHGFDYKFIADDSTYNIDSIAVKVEGSKPINAGVYELLLSSNMFANVNEDYEVEFIVAQGEKSTLTILPAEVSQDGDEPWGGDGPRPCVGGEGVHSLYSTESTYDGFGHTIDVETLSKIKLVGGDSPQISYALTSNGVYQTEPIYFTNSCFTSIWYRVESPNHKPYIHEAGISILPRPVCVVSGSAQKNYDGMPLTAHSFSVGRMGFVGDDGVELSYEGAQTWPGSSANGFSYRFKSNTRPENYDVTCEFGVLKVGAEGDISIPDGETSIPENAFSGYVGLMQVVIPESVKYVGANAFAGCTSLVKIDFPAGLDVTRAKLNSWGLSDEWIAQYCRINDYLVAGSTLIQYVGDASVKKLTVPAGIVRIDKRAFAALGGLEEIEFSGTEKIIGKGAFFRDTKLTKVILHEGIEQIGDEAFFGCTKMANVIIPSSVKSVGAHAFKQCTALTNAQISYGVESIGEECFYSDWQIEQVDIPSTVTNIGVMAFGGDSSIIRAKLRADIRPMSEIFSNYKHIREVGVKICDREIVDGCFRDCVELKDVFWDTTIPCLIFADVT